MSLKVNFEGNLGLDFMDRRKKKEMSGRGGSVSKAMETGVPYLFSWSYLSVAVFEEGLVHLCS